MLSGVLSAASPLRRSGQEFSHRRAPLRNVGPFNTESYDTIEENRFPSVDADPPPTLSIPSHTASYANVRRFLNEGALPPPGRGAHRGAGQLLPLRLSAAKVDAPFSITTELAACPWNPSHRLALIGLQGAIQHRRAAARTQPRLPHRRAPAR